jgi:hypothetical protein
MPANQLYHTWSDRIRQLCPTARKTLIHNFTWLLIGIYLSGKVHLSVIANKLPGAANLPSAVQRLRRLLQSAICVRKWYGPIAEELLKSQAQHGHIRLVVDGTKVSFHHRLLMVSIAFRRRAIPIVWTWVKSKRGHSSALKQCALLAYVHSLVPNDVSVSIVGDCEFGAVAVMQQLDAWEWQYVLRQKGDTLIDMTLHNHWQRFDETIDRPGQSNWLGDGHLTKEHVYRTNLLAHWKHGEKEPWLLATNFPTLRLALRAYRRRMWIEVVCTQMTKTSLLARFAGWNDIADLNLVIVNDDTIDEKFYQLPPLLKGSLVQSLLNALTECLDRGGYGSHFESFLSLGFHLVQLDLQRLLFLDDFPALTLKLG